MGCCSDEREKKDTFYIAYERIKIINNLIKDNETKTKNISYYLIPKKSLPNFIESIQKSKIFENQNDIQKNE